MEKKELANEIIILTVASLFAGLVLAIKIQWPILSIEPKDLLWMSLFSLLLFSVFIIAQKIVAYFLDCKTRSKLLSFRRFWFKPITEQGRAEFSFEFPAWLVLPLLLLLVNIKWLAILNFDVEPLPARTRRKWSNITEADIAKISIAGPFSAILLAVILRIFNTDLAFLAMLLAFLTLLPIGIGFKLFNSSRILWFFSFVFSLVLLLIIKITMPIASIIIALILAALATLVYYTLFEK